MENYLWAMGMIFEPQFSKCRIGITKFVCILLAIDDMYDIYGSLDELESFTDAVDRYKNKTNIINYQRKYCKNNDKNFVLSKQSLRSQILSLFSLLSFSNTLSRWDMKAMEDLPQYMKICYVAILNYVNEVVFGVIKDDQDLDTLPYIKEAVRNLK
jgi:hypothetical protein